MVQERVRVNVVRAFLNNWSEVQVLPLDWICLCGCGCKDCRRFVKWCTEFAFRSHCQGDHARKAALNSLIIVTQNIESRTRTRVTFKELEEFERHDNIFRTSEMKDVYYSFMSRDGISFEELLEASDEKWDD